MNLYCLLVQLLSMGASLMLLYVGTTYRDGWLPLGRQTISACSQSPRPTKPWVLAKLQV